MVQPFTDFKKAYDSVRREALYNILIESGIPRKVQGFDGKARRIQSIWKTKA
jgi:hypothetical protein